MDKHRAHDILHTYNGGKSENCPSCNGSMDEKTMKTEAAKIATENYKPRTDPTIPFEKRLMQYADKDGNIPLVDEASMKLRDMNSDIRPMVNVLSFAESNTKIPTRIKVIAYGEYKMARYGKVKIDKAKVEEMVKHFNDNVRASSSEAGLPIDIEHGTTSYKDAAAGWLKRLTAGEDGGYADIEWTKLGEDLLKNKIYKFYSPEFWFKYIDPENTDIKLDNVMTGGGLVNKPMLKHDLKPIVNSEAGDENNLLTENKNTSTIFPELEKSSEKNMQLSEILKKAKADRSAEEQKFLVDNQDKLSFGEAKAEGFAEAKAEKKNETPSANQITLSEDQVVVEKSKLDSLVSLAEKGSTAFEQLRKANLKERVEKAVFSEQGSKIPTDQVDVSVDLLLSMSEENQEKYLAQLKALPEKQIFAEIGSTKETKGSAAGDDLEKQIQAYKEEHKCDYAAAAIAVTSANPTQFKEYSDNLPVAEVQR